MTFDKQKTDISFKSSQGVACGFEGKVLYLLGQLMVRVQYMPRFFDKAHTIVARKCIVGS